MLADTHARLDEHFLLLSRPSARLLATLFMRLIARTSFILEVETTIGGIILARELSRQRLLSPAHWLLWVVVAAAEIGYAYGWG